MASRDLNTTITLDRWFYFKEQHIIPAKILARVADDFREKGYTAFYPEDVQSRRYKRRVQASLNLSHETSGAGVE